MKCKEYTQVTETGIRNTARTATNPARTNYSRSKKRREKLLVLKTAVVDMIYQEEQERV